MSQVQSDISTNYLKLQDLQLMNPNKIIEVNRALIHLKQAQFTIQNQVQCEQRNIIMEIIDNYFNNRKKKRSENARGKGILWGYDMKIGDILTVFGKENSLPLNSFREKPKCFCSVTCGHDLDEHSFKYKQKKKVFK